MTSYEDEMREYTRGLFGADATASESSITANPIEGNHVAREGSVTRAPRSEDRDTKEFVKDLFANVAYY